MIIKTTTRNKFIAKIALTDSAYGCPSVSVSDAMTHDSIINAVNNIITK